MRAEIYMVRHAHSNYSSDELDRGVSYEAKEDIDIVTELLTNEGIEVVVSSPYKRAIETVKDIAEVLGMNIELIESFKERRLSGTPVEDFDGSVKCLWQNPTFSFEGGEANVQAAQRGIAGINYILDKHNGKRIAIGTHGNIIAIIMNYYDKKYDYSFWKSLSMPDIYRLSFENYKLLEVKRVWQK